MFNFDIWKTLDMLPGIILGLSIHEAAHAWTAWKLGDETARSQGRVTLNPLEHIDVLGLIFIIFAGFGWAKPVQFQPEQLKHPQRDIALIALAGPLSNALLAIVLSAIWVFSAPGLASSGFGTSVSKMLFLAVVTNWGLFVFNLIPLPPLDGSHLIFGGLRTKPELYATFYRFGTLGLLGILIFCTVTQQEFPLIGAAVRGLLKWGMSLFGF